MCLILDGYRVMGIFNFRTRPRVNRVSLKQLAGDVITWWLSVACVTFTSWLAQRATDSPLSVSRHLEGTTVGDRLINSPDCKQTGQRTLSWRIFVFGQWTHVQIMNTPEHTTRCGKSCCLLSKGFGSFFSIPHTHAQHNNRVVTQISETLVCILVLCVLISFCPEFLCVIFWTPKKTENW
jgi:hypothetical protein